MQAKDITVKEFLRSCKNTVDQGRINGWIYGNSTKLPPCSDKIISCDRLIARALWDLGFTDQRKGGQTCGSLDNYLSKHGFIRSMKFSDIKEGSIILVKHSGISYWSHAFVALKFNPNNFLTDRYDTGSNQRIQSVQPLKNLAWGYRRDTVLVYNIPEQSKEPTPHKLIATGQKLLRDFLGLGGLPRATGLYTNEWKDLYVKGIQSALNKDLNMKLKVTGMWNQNTRLGISREAIRKDSVSNLVSLFEIGLYLNNIDPKGYELPGHFGKECQKQTNAIRRKLGLKETGVAGILVFEELAGKKAKK